MKNNTVKLMDVALENKTDQNFF